jgi:single-strand DNA-binding protein
MARNYNKILLVGVIETEMSLRVTTNGTAVTNFTLTTSNKWINKAGEKQNYKKWHHIVCWGRLAEQVVSSFQIGDTVLVEGSISYRQYEKDDKKLKAAEIKATNVTLWEGSLNKVILVGNVGSELSLRKTTNDTSVTNFSLSTIDKWRDKSGEVQSHKKWHRTVCWGKTAEVAVDSVKNGSLVLIEGSISYRTYINKEGIKNNHIAEIKTSQLTKWANPLDESKTIKSEDKGE